MSKMTGVIIRLLPNRGYGFIRGKDLQIRFMHARDAKDFELMHEGLLVSFTPLEKEVNDKHNGLRAIDVEKCLDSKDQ